jgi:hypothetical protein
MVSSPSDVVELNVDEERHRLDQSLEALANEGHVEVVWLEPYFPSVTARPWPRDS